LCKEEVSLARAIEIRGVDRAGEVGHEHAIARHIQRMPIPSIR
jgi:hypothetical protein